VVVGSAFADTPIGGDGNDNLRGNAGNDTLDGGAGTADVAQYTSATTGITVNLDTGIVQDGQGGTDSLAGIEQIWGSGFNDSMLGGNEADFFVGSTGADTFDGGLGVDAVNYLIYTTNVSSPTQGVSVDRATGTARDAFGGLDRLFGIEVIEGSSFADTITGGAANEVIRGNGGADSLSGGAGNDWISGSTGNERLQGGAGSDSIDAGSGDDTLWGNLGQDTYVGGVGADLFFLTHQENFSSGDAGSFVSAQDVVQDFHRLEGDKLGLFGGLYQDVSGTNRTLAWYGTIGDGNAVASLNAGVALPDGASSDQVRAYWLPRIGGDGWLALDLNRDGVLNTNDFAVFVSTSDNAALVVNNFETGTVFSGSVNNNDMYNGTGNAETYDGGLGNDLLNGFAGNDSLIGGSGDDSLSGGDGNDALSGDAGNDVAMYSDARTAYRFSLDNGALIVTDPTGTDRLQGIERLRFGSDAPLEVASLGSMNLIEEVVTIIQDGVTTKVFAEDYSGPVAWLHYQMLGNTGGDVMIVTSRNEFFNLFVGVTSLMAGTAMMCLMAVPVLTS
jgi:Ca2+-binding RTX toxin-like protein